MTMTMTATALRTDPRIVPRAKRHDVDVYAEIEGPTVHAFESRVLNISASGMLLAEAGQLKIGDVVYAKIAGRGSTLCTIVRLKNGSAGVKFENAMLPESSQIYL
jgi:hypothetical protein